MATKAYGSWPSPLSTEDLTAAKSARDISIDSQTQSVYWNQVVPAEEGRGQLFKRTLASTDLNDVKPLLPLGYDCRSRVHEYGGGSFSVEKGLLVFVNDTDKAVYTLDIGKDDQEPVRLTSPNTFLRYADFCIDPSHQFVLAVQEEHFENEEPKDVVNRLVAIQLSSGNVKVVAEGADFYTSPRLDSSGHFAFVSWMHPNMPWDFTQLSYGAYHYSETDSFVVDGVKVINDGVDESIVQPQFGIDDTLYFVSDRSGFWNLYLFDQTTGSFVLLLKEALEQEFAGSAWGLNMSWYQPFKSDASKLACLNKGMLAVIDTKAKTMTNVQSDYTIFATVTTVIDCNTGHELVVANACSKTRATDLIAYDIQNQAIHQVTQPSKDRVLDPSYISEGEEIAFPTTNNLTAYCYFYAPKNADIQGPAGQLPPLRVMSHGGPTSSVDNAYSSTIQYWTTRGFAVADVNYGGSDGYGRAYRNRLQKQWGVVDVDDCCNAALYLADQGLVDKEKLAIEGGSAGGYTTLAALAFRNVFKAGICLYGISDITLLVRETHKFESKYCDRLIGEYPADKDVYEQRSPINSADNLQCPVIFFQGEDDKVVPPSQAEVMVNTMRNKGLPVAYVLYPGEGHGFRRAENITRTLELEQWFLGQIFGFEVDGVQGVPIDNFPSQQ
ncbi:alpha/beta-hydrolase [Hesseltinella vesiculosa]|uniref:Alpha/beta-hydrolase n=1 Tax=Hesseltinella vesiculosa TaxID=101127 RepID=A0A1X2GUZ2_9FUNG|nr:alpha/beta-hydrolase [Hesseltinella vesiculosa]